MRSLYIVLVVQTLLSQTLFAQTIGPQTEELKFSYRAEFLADQDMGDPESLARLHLSHLFGVLHSPTLVKRMGVPRKIEGVAVPRLPAKITVERSISRVGDEGQSRWLIRYRASGIMLMHKNAAREVLRTGSWSLPLPADLNTIYFEECTDSYYSSVGDYWYFYDPFRAGCAHLSAKPFSHEVVLTMAPAFTRKLDQDLRLDLLKGDNGNADKFLISVVHGFAEDKNHPDDDGRRNYEALNEYLKKEGFVGRELRPKSSRPLSEFSKSKVLDNGRSIQISVRHLLVETGAETKGLTFARFFKQAVEESDVFVYAGHSGLGANLDIDALERKAGEFQFNSQKRQLFYFDSCASYSYYLHPFRAEKTRAKLDLITNGLSSYFSTGPQVLEQFLEPLLGPQSGRMLWTDYLGAMESPLKGASYFVNVGGI